MCSGLAPHTRVLLMECGGVSVPVGPKVGPWPYSALLDGPYPALLSGPYFRALPWHQTLSKSRQIVAQLTHIYNILPRFSRAPTQLDNLWALLTALPGPTQRALPGPTQRALPRPYLGPYLAYASRPYHLSNAPTHTPTSHAKCPLLRALLSVEIRPYWPLPMSRRH